MSQRIMSYRGCIVTIGLGVRHNVIDWIREKKPYKTVIITDETIEKLYQAYIDELIEELDIEDVIAIEPGEVSKNIDTAIKLWKKLFDNGLTRKSLIIGLGGGVVLDITGFIASTFMRGIDYITIPTTLLSQADSSIGGKTGIDFIIKNGIGTIYLPKATFIDPYFITTLPRREIKSGFAEIIKHSIIEGGKLYEIVKQYRLEDIVNDQELLASILIESIRVKIDIIERDLYEEGLRRVLNLGHTIGHAIEKLMDYKIPHGYAVSIGLSMESWISSGLLGFTKYSEIVEILDRYDLPRDIDIDVNQLIEAMKMDKKNWRGKIVMTLVRDIGDCIAMEVDEESLKTLLGRYS